MHEGTVHRAVPIRSGTRGHQSIRTRVSNINCQRIRRIYIKTLSVFQLHRSQYMMNEQREQRSAEELVQHSKYNMFLLHASFLSNRFSVHTPSFLFLRIDRFQTKSYRARHAKSFMPMFVFLHVPALACRHSAPHQLPHVL